MTRTTTFGPCYDEQIDGPRINRQLRELLDLMRDQQWRSLAEISQILSMPEASVSANLRHLRKERFGAWRVEKRRRYEGGGTWEYQVLKPEPRGQYGLPFIHK